MDTNDLENNVVQFERTQRSLDQATTIIESAPLSDPSQEQPDCVDGVCVLVWKPRRPPNIAA
jgi:hypothetical protein